MQVYLVQMESIPGKKNENLEKARQMGAELARLGKTE